MKRCFILFFTLILILSTLPFAEASGYTLPEKLQKQLVVGSGLKGSFVIHGHFNADLCPLLSAVSNTEFEVRGIQSEENLHYYIYQPGDNEVRNALTELLKTDGRWYLRSDLLNTSFLLPETNHLVNAYLNSEGENPSVFPELMKILFSGNINTNDEINTAFLEKQIENWITGFSPETTIQTSEDGTPSLSQSFSIPVDSMYNTVLDLINTVFHNDSAMTFLRSVLSDEQIALYLNPDLAYYYLDALKSLDLQGSILFTRTVSTMGTPMFTSLTLPLDASKTGYSFLTVQNDESRKSILITGPKGLFWIEMPLDFNWKDAEYNQEFRVLRVYADNEESRNISLQINVKKTYETNDDSDEGRANETYRYSVHVIRNTADLPVDVSEEQIPDMDPIEADIEFHYSSKLQLSSPTTLEVSVSVVQGQYNFDLTGKVKTASPWEFTPFDISDAVDTGAYTLEDYKDIGDFWIQNAGNLLTHTPEEIQMTNVSDGTEGQNP